MKKIMAWVVGAWVGSGVAASAGDIWLHMLSSGAPFAGTYYVGDSVGNGGDWWLQFEVGWHTWNASEGGIGPDTTDDGDWNWDTANWYQNGDGNNRRIQRNIGSFRFSSAGNWYVNGRVKEDSWDPWHYANNTDWNHLTSFSPAYYFTVNALNNPGSQSATAASGSQIDLSWSADAQGHWVMIVRSTDASFTAPSQGTGYNVGDTIGGDLVVYKGGGTSMSDTGLTGGRTYYYKFHSENWSYYSAGVEASATTPRSTDSTWDGGGGDNNFKTEANWNNDSYPDQGSSTKLTFAGATRLSPNNDWAAGSTFNEIFFDSGAGAFTLGGNAFNIRTKIVNNDDSLQTINNNLTFPAQEVELKAESGALTVGGTIANGGYRLASSGANTLTLGGVLSGTGDVLMYGSGTLVLGAANTFAPASGNAAYLVNGTTRVNHSSGLGVGTVHLGETFGSSPATLQIGASGVNVGNNITVRTGSGGTLTLGNSSAGTATFSGGVTLEQGVTLANNSGGTLDLGGSMSFNGGQKFITLNSGHTAKISGAIGTDGGGGLVKKGDGTLQLGGANTFAGLYIDRGTVELTAGSLAAGSTLDIGTTGGDGGSAAALKVSANSYTLGRNIVVQNAAGSRALETANTANTLTFSGTVTLNKSLTATIGNGSAAVDAEFAGEVSGAGGLTKAGAGTLLLSAANSYAGNTAVSAGTLRLGANDRISDDSLVDVSAGATLEVNDAYDKIKGLTGSGSVALGAGTGDRLRVGGDGADRTFSGVISGAGNVVKEGAGIWTLSGANTYTGDTKIEAGTVRLSANDRLGDDTLVNVSAGATFDLNEFYDKVKGLTGAGNVTLGTTAGDRLRVGGDNVDRTFSGVISEGGHLVKEGTGILTLSGANTYTGETKIEGGTLRLGANDRLSDDTLVNVSAGATFDVNDAYDKIKGLAGAGSVALGSGTGDRLRVGGDHASRTFSGSISGGGNVVKEGTGTWTLSGTSTFSGNLAVDGGVVVAGGSSANAAHAVASGAFLYGAGTVGALTISGQASAGAASNTVGQLAASALNLESSGRLQVNLAAMTGTAGTDWDLVVVGGGAGTYTVNAVNGSDFVIALKGNPAFDNLQGYTNVLVSAGASSGFAADKFTVSTQEFTPGLGGGSFSVDDAGGDLRLIFTPPATPPAPAANAASDLGFLGFTANWSASAGATGYRLDVAIDSAFTSMVSGYNNLAVGGTLQAVTVPAIGVYYYRVRAENAQGASGNSSTIMVGTLQVQGRNKNGGAPYYTPATVYVGDTVTFGVDTWGELNDNWGKGRAVIDTDANIAAGGLYGDWQGSYDDVEYTEVVSPRFTSAGTWYWGVQMEYTIATYGTNLWLVRDQAGWADLYYIATNANLTIPVLALENPSGVSATQNGGSPGSAIDLGWTLWNSRDVMVVRSTDASFGTPTPGVVYSAGQTISGDTVVYKGSGTSFTDTGLGGGTTYHYRYYSENYGYYSAGADASASTAGAAPAAPAAQAATLVGTASFQANWNASAGATSYRLDVSTVNTFASYVAGYQDLNVGNVIASTVSGLTAGNTYYYRVRAVNGSGTSGNSGTITVTLPATATVAISELPPSGGNGTLTFAATVGAYYDVYYSDSDPAGAMTWNLVDQVQANANPMTTSVTEDSRRYFKVVIAGANAAASSSPVWGVVKPTVAASTFTLMGTGVDGDLRMDGAFGSALADALTGHAGGVGDSTGDELLVLQGDGSWRNLYLDDNDVWRESNGDVSSLELDPGQGFYVLRNAGSSATPRFVGAVGNTGAETLSMVEGWNIFSPSQGKNLSLSAVFSSLNGGSLNASWDETESDLVVIRNANGTWRRIMRAGDNTWFDLSTFATANLTLLPGDAVFFYRASDTLDVSF
jgi:autotransporter-associated beta strand protein